MNDEFIIDEIHIWDLPDFILTSVCVDISKEFKNKLFNKLLNIFSSKAEIARFLNNASKKYNIKRNYRTSTMSRWMGTAKEKRDFLPLWMSIELTKNFECSLYELESSIKTMEYYGGHIKIKPNFPILVTPELVSIVAHFFGDGYAPSPHERCRTPHYKQFNSRALNQFKRKIKNIFGDFKYRTNSEIDVYIPRLFIDILSWYFDIKSFKSKESIIPEAVFEMPKEFRVAFFFAFLVDEGTIDHRINIFSSNSKLLDGIRRIGESLGYKCSKVRRYNEHELYFSISLKSVGTMLGDVISLQRNFPTCGLAHKQKNLEFIYKVQTRGWKQRKQNESKKLIMKSLKSSHKSTKDLSYELTLLHTTTRYHLNKLKREGLVEPVKIGRKFIWRVR